MKDSTRMQLEKKHGDDGGKVIVVDTPPQELCYGLDVSDRFTQVCVRTGAGEILNEVRARTSREALRNHFSTTIRGRVALEVGTHSRWISKELEELGFTVYVANARKLRGIYQSDTKTDKCDARFLSEIVAFRPALLCPIKHRGEEAQADLAMLRARAALVRTRTLLINHVRTTVKAVGGRMVKTSSAAFCKQTEALPDERRMILEPLMKQIREQTAYIRGYDKLIQERVESYPEAALLMRIPGVGPQDALTFICTIEDPWRFKNVRKIGSYLGLRPRLDESGDLRKQLSITKSGDADLRRLLVSSAQYILGPFGPDCDLKRWGDKLTERGGTAPRKKAVIAVARKLAVLMLALWKTGSIYDPTKLSKKTEPTDATRVAPVEPASEVPELTSPPITETRGTRTRAGSAQKRRSQVLQMAGSA